jgi:hypothetical protein
MAWHVGMLDHAEQCLAAADRLLATVGADQRHFPRSSGAV